LTNASDLLGGEKRLGSNSSKRNLKRSGCPDGLSLFRPAICEGVSDAHNLDEGLPLLIRQMGRHKM
jgi:hypothetical protein